MPGTELTHVFNSQQSVLPSPLPPAFLRDLENSDVLT